MKTEGTELRAWGSPSGDSSAGVDRRLVPESTHAIEIRSASLRSDKAAMGEMGSTIRCTNCQRVIEVEPEWRLTRCPACGAVNVRMSEDSAYD